MRTAKCITVGGRVLITMLGSKARERFKLHGPLPLLFEAMSRQKEQLDKMSALISQVGRETGRATERAHSESRVDGREAQRPTGLFIGAPSDSTAAIVRHSAHRAGFRHQRSSHGRTVHGDDPDGDAAEGCTGTGSGLRPPGHLTGQDQ